jgi:hypothetical protein
MQIPAEKRLLTLEEIAELETRADVIKVQIDFGAAQDSTKELTVSEYSEFVTAMCKQYEGTALEPILSVIAWCYSEKAKMKARELMMPPKVHYFSRCGGCGCNPTPLPSCYVGGLGCFSCPTT